MKRSLRTVLSLAVAVLLLAAISVPALAAEFDFEGAISGFHSASYNTHEMEPGQTHTPSGAMWISSGAKCYSSDESVVVIGEDGTVTAVGEGTAYAVVVAAANVYDLHCYIVSIPEETVPETEPEETVPETESPEETIPETEPVKDTAVTPNIGISNKNPLGVQDMQNIGKEMLKHNDQFEKMSAFVSFMFVLVGVLFVVVIVVEVNASRFSKRTLQTKVLPPVKITDRTVQTPAFARTACPNCGQEYGDTDFCGKCGTPKQTKNVHTFALSGKTYAMDFEAMANQWLAENPYVYNCKLNVQTDWTSFAVNPKKKFYITKASIEFNVADKPQAYQRGVAFLYKKKYFRRGSVEALADKWLAQNGDCEILSQNGSRVCHWDNNAMTYSLLYNIVFFRKPNS